MPTVPASLPLATLRDLRRVDLEYGRADALAIHHQVRSDRIFRWFSYMAFVMGLAFLVYAKLLPSKGLLYVYVGILGASLLTFYAVKDRNWFSKHLVYRVLAETLRTEFFLHMAGAGREVNAAELIRFTGIDQFTGFSWIGIILKDVEATGPAADRERDDPAGVASTREHWIGDQRRYFTRKVHRLEHMKGGMIYLLMILTGLLVVFAKGLEDLHLGDRTLKDFTVFLMGLLPVCIGIWELYQNKMAMRELLSQYRNQHAHFMSAELRIARNTSLARQREILAEVGRKSLMESYLWTIHRFHREHEPPAAA
jgi:hypothetical protein